jgi:hypothetical protein
MLLCFRSILLTFLQSLEPMMTLSEKVSPYAFALAKVLENQPNLTDTEKRSFEKLWMEQQLLQNGITIKTGQCIYEFVNFSQLDGRTDQSRAAISEVQAGRMPSRDQFYMIFAIMCHLNDKSVDPDKLCMPRACRLIAISNELKSPGSTTAPEGYAGDNKAGWTQEQRTPFPPT